MNLDGLVVNDQASEKEMKGPEAERGTGMAGREEIEMHQVVTPCPVICQTFTPNFLNTPQGMPMFFNNYNFDMFDQREKSNNLFVRNE